MLACWKVSLLFFKIQPLSDISDNIDFVFVNSTDPHSSMKYLDKKVKKLFSCIFVIPQNIWLEPNVNFAETGLSISNEQKPKYVYPSHTANKMKLLLQLVPRVSSNFFQKERKIGAIRVKRQKLFQLFPHRFWVSSLRYSYNSKNYTDEIMEGYSNHIRIFMPTDDSRNLNISHVLVSQIHLCCSIRTNFFEQIITIQLKKIT